MPDGADSERNLDKPECGHHHDVRGNVFYRCTVENCPLRHVKEAYFVVCGQSTDCGLRNDQMYIRGDHEYLLRYREGHERVSAAHDTDSISIGGDTLDINSLASELDAVICQRQLISEGRGHEVRPTTK